LSSAIIVLVLTS